MVSKENLKGVSSFKGVLMKCQGCLNKDSRLFHRSFKGGLRSSKSVSRLFQRSFQDVPIKIEGSP